LAEEGRPAVAQRSIGRTTRRTIFTVIAAALAPRLLIAQAQSRDEMRRLGVLMGGSRSDDGRARAIALVQGLGALNWHDGGDLHIDWRWADGDPAFYERCAVELIALDPEVLVAWGSPGVAALRRHSNTIPIVIVNVTDPVGQGFVKSLAHPGGNITGFTDYDPPMAGKWLGMLAQIIPPVAHVAVLFNPATAPFAGMMVRVIEESAPSLAMAARAAPCRDDAEIEAMTAGLAREERGGLLILPENFNIVHRETIITLAAWYRLPAVYPYRFFTATGGLMSYGIDPYDLFRRAASYVDRILKGAKPADFPVQNPSKFELVINMKTARVLGITVAPSLLATADEVIE
jgi:putative tryptophan/tyrosine transport system substrate-binding protein